MAEPPQEQERLEALARAQVVDTLREEELDDLARLAAELCACPLAAFVLIDRDRLWVKAAEGLPPGAYPRAGSPCQAVLEHDAPLATHDLSAFTAHPWIAQLGVRAYMGVPLRSGEHVVGTLAVMDTRERDFEEDHRTRLLALARQGSALLELRRLRAQPQQALLRSATRISGIGCWEWNLVTGELLLSEEMFQIFGTDPSEPPALASFFARIHPEDRERVVLRTNLARSGELFEPHEYRIIRADGAIRTVHSSQELAWEDGRPARLTGVLHDVTAQRAAEEQRHLATKNKLQLQKLESLGVLAAGVAHDFNNLLVGVQGNAELALADRSLAPTSRDLIERIMEAAERAGALTRQLLAYTGRSHLRLSDLDLSAQLRGLLQRVSAGLPASITLRVELGSELLAVRADAEQLQLLTSNLLENAVESYGAARTGEVRLRTFSSHVEGSEPHDLCVPRALEPGRYVVLEVADHGCGMAASTLERAIEPFFSTKFTGRGLGLSAALGIARSHRGVLAIDSRPGEGSRVRLYLPALVGKPVQPAREVGPLRAGSLAGHTVLLVDDEQMVRNVERLALQRLGLRVLEAAEGQQAIDTLSRERGQVDLVVLDLMMPGLDAATTLRGLRALRPDLPVIVQSGYPEEEATRSLEEVDGRLDFLQKPFSVQTLIQKVAALLVPA